MGMRADSRVLTGERHTMAKAKRTTAKAKNSTTSAPGTPPRTGSFRCWWHVRGGWTVWVDGKRTYLGRDTKTAQVRFNTIVDRLKRGLEARTDAPTIADACLEHIRTMEARRDAGLASMSTLRTCETAAGLLLKHARASLPLEAIRPSDLEPVRNAIVADRPPGFAERLLVAVRRILRDASEVHGLAERPIRIGHALKGPSQRDLVLHRDAKGRQHLEPQELAAVIGKVGLEWRSTLVLCWLSAMAPVDVVSVKVGDLEPEGRGWWLSGRRSKTAESRLCWIPAGAAKLVREALKARGVDGDGEALVLANGYGRPWASAGALKDSLSRVLVENHGKGSPYWIRRGSATCAAETGDLLAVAALLGHKPKGLAMTAHYVRDIPREPVRRVGEHLWKRLAEHLPKNGAKP